MRTVPQLGCEREAASGGTKRIYARVREHARELRAQLSDANNKLPLAALPKRSTKGARQRVRTVGVLACWCAGVCVRVSARANGNFPGRTREVRRAGRKRVLGMASNTRD